MFCTHTILEVDIEMAKQASLMLVSILLLPTVISAAVVDTLRARIDTLEVEVDKLKEKIEATEIRFGLSVGPRTVTKMSDDEEKGFVNASISPVDSTLQLDKRDKHDFFLSAVLAITPFVELAPPKSDCRFKRAIKRMASRLTFLVNINLSNLTSDIEGVGFNKRIEGGFGLGLLLHHNFAIGGTYERVFNRPLRKNILNMEGTRIVVDGQSMTELDPKRNDIFTDDYLKAWSLKFIFFY